MIDQQPTKWSESLEFGQENGDEGESEENDEEEEEDDDNGKKATSKQRKFLLKGTKWQQIRRTWINWRRNFWWLPMAAFGPRKRRRQPAGFRHCLCSALLAFPPFLLLLWISGLHEFLMETPFSEFRWPPYVDVRKQVILEMLGQSTQTPPINFWPQFRAQVLIKPDCPKNPQNRLSRKKHAILAIVKSAPDRIERRQAIRATYGSSNWANLTAPSGDGGIRLRTVFAMGRPPENQADVMAKLEAEAVENGDLLVGNFVDNYYNNTLKFVHSIGLAKEYCAGEDGGFDGPVPFLALFDDDYLVLPWNLVAEVDKHIPSERLYLGWRYDSSPFRFRLRKYRISLAEYPFNVFPPYITGGAVLMTGQTVAEFHAAIQHTAFFKFDDIYAGILAHMMGISPQHNPNFVPHSHRLEANWWQTLVAAHDYGPNQLRQTYGRALAEWRRTRKGNKNQ